MFYGFVMSGMVPIFIYGASIWTTEGQAWDEINSKKILHAWNEVYVNNRWVIEDTTWDSGYVNLDTLKFGFHLCSVYFDPSAEVFARDHKKLSEVM